jgi:hypothetical protein
MFFDTKSRTSFAALRASLAGMSRIVRSSCRALGRACAPLRCESSSVRNG